jgi:hypothetical protein
MTFKEKTYQLFEEMINNRIATLQHELLELQESAANETKSSVGDKYETARAMLQIEQDNVRRRLQEAMEQKSLFATLPANAGPVVARGSLVCTSKGWLLIGVALGKIKVDDVVVIAVSPQSPLGSKLVGLKVGERVEVNGVRYEVESIL